MRPYYEDSRAAIQIFNCDYRELLPILTKPDLVVIDPPYELSAKGGGIGAQPNYMQDIDEFTDGGFDMDLLDQFQNWFCFCSKNQLVRLLQKAAVRRWMLIPWIKPFSTPLCCNNYLPDVEYIVHSFESGRLFGEHKDKSRYIHCPAQNGFRKESSHPNEKPATICGKLIRLGSQPGELVVDLFCGSGSTLVSAKALGRRAIGCDVSEQWCEQAATRLDQETLQFQPQAAREREQELKI